MNILVINSGSSSIKYTVYEMNEEKALATGLIEKLGSEEAIVRHQAEGKPSYVESLSTSDHASAIHQLFQLLVHPQRGVLKQLQELDAVGHRVVHGGELFRESVLIDESVMEGIEKMSSLAPLHNPANLMGIRNVKERLPGVKQVAVFDTAFHQTMPEHAYLYALPFHLYQDHQIRRYGFHGTSHAYVAQEAARTLGTDLTNLKMVTCHLGNGVSLTAVDRGISIDTSMGMTPLEGVMMGTRSGSIDPALVPYLMEVLDLDAHQVLDLLNHHSGLKGVSDRSNDLRVLLEAKAQGDHYANLAIHMYVYQIQKMIGAMITALQGCDALVFTAGVGENSSVIREKICQRFGYLGVQLDPERNDSPSDQAREISHKSSRIKVLVVPTNEELMIARETKALVEP